MPHLSGGRRWEWWKNQAPTKHLWAFYYFCRRRGDEVRKRHNPDGTIDLVVIYNDPGP
jgi:hypothetical protein